MWNINIYFRNFNYYFAENEITKNVDSPPHQIWHLYLLLATFATKYVIVLNNSNLPLTPLEIHSSSCRYSGALQSSDLVSIKVLPWLLKIKLLQPHKLSFKMMKNFPRWNTCIANVVFVQLLYLLKHLSPRENNLSQHSQTHP